VSGLTLSLRPPEGLLLDAMGTLIGLRQSVGTTYAAVAAEHGLSVEPTAIDRAFPAILRQAPPLAFPGQSGADLLEAETRWWGDRIASAMEAAGAPPPPEALRRDLFERFADSARWRIYDDVLEPLRRWHGSGLRLGIVSNFDQRLHRLLAGLGLEELFTVVVVSSAAGAAKPSPLPFRLALEGMDLRPERAWHIGDSPEDAAGAEAAGLPCLLIRRR
jgi:putative hydrolase of the HAD superfamily